MELTKEQAKKFENALHLNEGAIIVCPICQGIDWNLNPYIFEYPDYQGTENRSPFPKRVFPVIILSCMKCSYCISFSAANLGFAMQDNNQDEVKRNTDTNSWKNIPFLKCFFSGLRRDQLILLLRD
jgi:hypothetical protein